MPEVQFDTSSYLIYFSVNYYITNIIRPDIGKLYDEIN